MMIKILDTVYSLPFFLGAVVGTIFWTIYCHQKAHWQDKHYPLPDGRRRYVNHISRVWLAAMALTLSLGYILLTAQKTHDQTLQLAKNVAECWAESYQAAKANIDLNAQNDIISRQQQELQRDYDRATSDWLKLLVNPPGELANQPTNSPARQQWGLQITAQYQTKLNDLGTEYDDLVNQRKTLDNERAARPLPETKCGK